MMEDTVYDSMEDAYKANLQPTIPYEWDEPISERTCQVLKVLGRDGYVCWKHDSNLDVATDAQLRNIASEYGLIFTVGEVCVLIDTSKVKVLD